MKNSLKDSNRDDLKAVAAAIADIKVCMITTVDHNGTMCSRPMYAQQIDADGSLWFFTLSSSHLIEDIRRVPAVNVTFSSPDSNTYISASAVGYEAFDREKMAELWSPALKIWFKDGLDTPDLALLKIDLQEIEMWDAPSSSVFKIVNFVKSVVSDDASVMAGHHEKFNLRQ